MVPFHSLVILNLLQVAAIEVHSAQLKKHRMLILPLILLLLVIPFTFPIKIYNPLPPPPVNCHLFSLCSALPFLLYLFTRYSQPELWFHRQSSNREIGQEYGLSGNLSIPGQ